MHLDSANIRTVFRSRTGTASLIFCVVTIHGVLPGRHVTMTPDHRKGAARCVGDEGVGAAIGTTESLDVR